MKFSTQEKFDRTIGSGETCWRSKVAARLACLAMGLLFGINAVSAAPPVANDTPAKSAVSVRADVAGAADLSGIPQAPAGKAWQVVFVDEFEGPALDETKWELMDCPRRGHRWSPKTFHLDNQGHAVFETKEIAPGKYGSPCIRTRGKFEHRFGYYVARCKLAKQPGHWSAFWLMGDSVHGEGDEGRDGTEIDIVEFPFRDGRYQHNLHWNGYGAAHKTAGYTSEPTDVMNGWHTFGVLWTEDEYIFDVDGKETWRTSAGGVCQVPLYLKLSEEIGEWDAAIAAIKKAKLPDRFLVDYVRVYDLTEAQAKR
ncbi:MAG: glycoside hydrolase family 16 protein [Planctomycetes bacterium]|nr:glycoside hydrolase family 16 protein [Planctomycetota bacterium]